MFFMVAVMPVEKQIPYPFSGMCSHCGRVCRYDVYMTASCLSLFFIPIFKFGKKYIIRMSCCGNVYLLDKEIGRRIEKGENIAISDNDITPYMGDFSVRKCCPNCNYEIKEDFIHCPKCGTRL